MGSMFHLADAASSYAELLLPEEKTCQTDLISCLDKHSIFREKIFPHLLIWKHYP